MSIVKSFKSTFSIKRKFVILLALVLIPLVILEIWSLNRLSTFGDQINKLEKTKQSLLLENQLLENQISKYSSLLEIEEKSKYYGFDKSPEVEYLKKNLVVTQ